MNRRRWAALSTTQWAVAVGGLIIVTVLAAALWLRGEEDAAWARIQAEGRMVVATDASYPPFSAVDADGNLFVTEYNKFGRVLRYNRTSSVSVRPIQENR